MIEAIGTRMLRGLGIEPPDDKASAPVVVVTESLASLVPARRASAIDPMVALRRE